MRTATGNGTVVECALFRSAPMVFVLVGSFGCDRFGSWLLNSLCPFWPQFLVLRQRNGFCSIIWFGSSYLFKVRGGLS